MEDPDLLEPVLDIGTLLGADSLEVENVDLFDIVLVIETLSGGTTEIPDVEDLALVPSVDEVEFEVDEEDEAVRVIALGAIVGG